MRIALKIAYDGRSFHGFARQPDVRTVEGEVAFALAKAALIRTPEDGRLRGASRTDAGVSALGNVVAFDAEAAPREAVGRFNDAARDVWAWAAAPVDATFDPRRANIRWYRYYLTEPYDPEDLGSAARPFVGRHDFAAFASPDAVRTRRVVDAVEVSQVESGIVIDVRAPSFLRGMVRRIVAALLAVERGDASTKEIQEALRTGRGRDLGTVPPEPLTLMDVELGVVFQATVDRACRERVRAIARDRVLAARFWSEASARVRSG